MMVLADPLGNHRIPTMEGFGNGVPVHPEMDQLQVAGERSQTDPQQHSRDSDFIGNLGVAEIGPGGRDEQAQQQAVKHDPAVTPQGVGLDIRNSLALAQDHR